MRGSVRWGSSLLESSMLLLILLSLITGRAHGGRAGQVIPGPATLPFVGAPDFLWRSAIGTPLTSTLNQYSRAYGRIFQVKTGPVTLVWVSDEKLGQKLLAEPMCSGRPESKGHAPFGEDLIFLTRLPEDAEPIRERQRVWMRKAAGTQRVEAAVREKADELLSAIPKGEGSWPSEKVSQTLLQALLTLFTGSSSANLSSKETNDLLLQLARYRKRSTGPTNPFAAKEDHAAEVRRILLEGLSRTGLGEDALPLLVSACVGGVEIFPLLLEWCIRRLALQPEVQQKLVDSGECSKVGPRPMTISVIGQIMRQCPYSSALGPPRKVLQNVEVEGFEIPEGALLFVMHPGLARGDSLPPPLLIGGQEESERLLQMFGGGPRSCIAAETSVAFLCCSLCIFLEKWRVSLSERHTAQELLSYKADGTLLVPTQDVKLIFEERKQLNR